MIWLTWNDFTTNMHIEDVNLQPGLAPPAPASEPTEALIYSGNSALHSLEAAIHKHRKGGKLWKGILQD